MRDPARKWHLLRFEPSPDKKEVECLECGKKMWLPPSKVREYLRCGLACNRAWKARRRAERTRACETCGATFTPRWGQLRAGKGRFCSQRCNTAGQRAGNSPGSRRKAWATRRAKIVTEGAAHDA